MVSRSSGSITRRRPSVAAASRPLRIQRRTVSGLRPTRLAASSTVSTPKIVRRSAAVLMGTIVLLGRRLAHRVRLPTDQSSQPCGRSGPASPFPQPRHASPAPVCRPRSLQPTARHTDLHRGCWPGSRDLGVCCRCGSWRPGTRPSSTTSSRWRRAARITTPAGAKQPACGQEVAATRSPWEASLRMKGCHGCFRRVTRAAGRSCVGRCARARSPALT